VAHRSRARSVYLCALSPTPMSLLHPAVRFVVLVSLFAVARAGGPPKKWGAEAFQPVTRARIAALPADQQPAWLAYVEESTRLYASLGARDCVDHSATKPLDGPPLRASYSRGVRLDAPRDWYASEEARTIADHVVNWQTVAGGWTKSGDYTRDRKPGDDHRDAWSAGTFDNDATIYELRFLALVNAAAADTPRARCWRDCFLRGLDYSLAAQYPNGGFPQIYPLVGWYHDAITFNDDAMVHILDLCRRVGARQAEYAFVPAGKAERAQRTVARGIACVLAAQLKDAAGHRTIWAQQNDALTLRPCAARNFEPSAACSLESAGLVLFLMSVPQPAPEIVAAIEGAMAWYPAHALHGVAWDRGATQGTGLVARDGAPDLWARFYELGTDQPIFGDRDRTIHYAVTELSNERRRGYGWFNSRPGGLPAAYAAWKERILAEQR